MSTKTRGETLYDAIIAAGAFGRGWDALDDELRQCYEQAAAEYDKARFALPEDVGAFVAEAEEKHNERAYETADLVEKIACIPRLLAIIRAHGAELAKNRTERSKDLSEMAQLANALDGVRSAILAPSLPDEEVSRAIGQIVDERDDLHIAICDAVGAPYAKQFDRKVALDQLRKERDALRGRLAKLEAAAREAYATHNEFRVSSEHSDAMAKLGDLVKGAEAMSANDMAPKPMEVVVKGSDLVIGYACPTCKFFHGATIYACKWGEAVRAAYEAAERCCNRKCDDCTEKVEQKHHRLCQACARRHEREQLQRKLDNATKVPEIEYDGGFFLETSDEYFVDTDAIEEHCADHEFAFPQWAWAAHRQELSIDGSAVVESILADEHHDGAEVGSEALKELQAFLDDWCKRQNVVSYVPDYSRVVVFEPRQEAQEESEYE